MKNSLKTAEKICDVLDAFSLKKSEWGVTDLSNHLDLSKSVVHRIASTLENKNYLYQDPKSKKYSLGNKIIELGSIAKNSIDLVKVSLKELNFLFNITEETVLLDVPKNNDNKSICLNKIESSKNIKYTCEIGKPVPIYAGALGKTILAHMSKEKINQIIDMGLKKHTNKTVTNPKVLKKQLKKIKKNGYAISCGEWNPGGMAIAAPLFSQNKILGSIGILGPEFRMKNKTDQYIEYCVEAAFRITKNL